MKAKAWGLAVINSLWGFDWGLDWCNGFLHQVFIWRELLSYCCVCVVLQAVYISNSNLQMHAPSPVLTMSMHFQLDTTKHLVVNWTMVLSNISNYKSEEWVIFYENEVYADDQFAVGIKCYSAVTHWAAQASDWRLWVHWRKQHGLDFSKLSTALLANWDSLPLSFKSVRSWDL